MPNWCQNELTITGEKDNVQKIKDIIDEFLQTPEDQRKPHQGLFLTLIGLPEDVTEITDENWYSLNTSWLGTKWDIFPNSPTVDYMDGFLFTTFDTAWTPPSNFCKELAKKYNVMVELMYMEEGNDFCGKQVYDVDGSVEEEEYTYLEGLYYFKEDDFEYEFENGLDFYDDSFDEDGDEDTESEEVDEVTDDQIREVLMLKYDYISESMADRLLDMIKEKNVGKQFVSEG